MWLDRLLDNLNVEATLMQKLRLFNSVVQRQSICHHDEHCTEGERYANTH